MINRLFFFIRPNVSIPFYYETTNYYSLLQTHLKNIDDDIIFSSGMIDNLIHYYKFSHPSIVEFRKITQNMYFDGDLKQEFKKCMRYTKDNNIAFGLAAVNAKHIQDCRIQRLQYFNVKQTDQKFIDSTYSQKVALGLYDASVGMDELVFTINFFDYEHNVKQVETRFVNTPEIWPKLREAQKQTCPNFMAEKNDYNLVRGIIEGKSSEENTQSPKTYIPLEVMQYMDPQLHTIKLDLNL